MSGKWIRRLEPGHLCYLPLPQTAGVGSEWLCDFGQRWLIAWSEADAENIWRKQ